MAKRSKQKRTTILMVVPVDSPDWISEEFRRTLSVLGPKQKCRAATVFLDQVSLEKIEEDKPDWLLIYCPEYGYDWICGLLVWLEQHPEVHGHVFYEKPTQSLPELPEPRRCTISTDEPDHILLDFCLQRSPPKRPA